MVNKKKTKTKSVRESKGVSLEEYGDMVADKHSWQQKYFDEEIRSGNNFILAILATVALTFCILVFTILFIGGNIDAVNVESFGQAICQENGQEYSHRDYVRKDVDGDFVRERVLRIHCTNNEENNLSSKLILLGE